MHTYAQINEDGICVAESQLSGPVEAQHMIPIPAADGSYLGKKWDGDEWQDGPQHPAIVDTRITRLAFRNRFTQAEKVALELAALDNPAAPTAQRQQSAALRAHLKDLDAASWVDLTRPETVAALQMLEAGGLIDEGRAAAILDVDSITDIERPQ
mgnify:CR=1 FL=1